MKRCLVIFTCLFLSFPVQAGQSCADWLHGLGGRESGLSPKKTNSYGYSGAFQFGESALNWLGYYVNDGNLNRNDWRGSWTGKNGINSYQAYLNNPDVQVRTGVELAQKNYNILFNEKGASQYIGKTINGVLVTESGLLAGAHLLGTKNVLKWLRTGNTRRDGYGTNVEEYVTKFGGYEVCDMDNIPSWSQVYTAEGGYGVDGKLSWVGKKDSKQPLYIQPKTTPLPLNIQPRQNQPTTPSQTIGLTPSLGIVPDDPFENGSGTTAQSLNQNITNLIINVLSMFSAWVVMSSFVAWFRRRISAQTFARDIIGLSLLMSVMFAVLFR